MPSSSTTFKNHHKPPTNLQTSQSLLNHHHRYRGHPWPEWMGVLHGDEIMFIFGETLKPKSNFSHADKRLSARMMTYWTNFAKTGFVCFMCFYVFYVFNGDLVWVLCVSGILCGLFVDVGVLCEVFVCLRRVFCV